MAPRERMGIPLEMDEDQAQVVNEFAWEAQELLIKVAKKLNKNSKKATMAARNDKKVAEEVKNIFRGINSALLASENVVDEIQGSYSGI